MEKLFKNSLLAFILTILVGYLLLFASTLKHEQGYGIVIGWGIILIPFFNGLPNLIFLLILYILKIGREYLLKIKYMLMEICLMYVCTYGVEELIALIPDKIIYYYQPAIKEDAFYIAAGPARRIFFNDYFPILYTYILLFVILLIIKKIFINRKVVSKL